MDFPRRLPRILFSLTTSLISLLICVPVFAQQSAESRSDPNSSNLIIEGQLLLQAMPGIRAEELIEEFSAYEIDITSLGPSFGVFRVDFDENLLSAVQLLRTLDQSDLVIHAQHNHRLQNRKTPGDPQFNLQWGLDNDGTGGIADADIDAPEAWDITTGGITLYGDTIVIAVIDDGFDLDHEDLFFWKNRMEIPGDGLDNDENGYVDDYLGWNTTDTNNIIPERLHGTHVCGIAAALGDNSIGIVGVNWNTPIIPIYADLEEDDVVSAYIYVAEMRKRYDLTNGAEGAFIVVTNSSFGIDFAQPDDYPIWCSMYDSLGQLGILNPAATINAFQNIDVIGDVPTACESEFMIAVTNTNISDEINNAGFGSTTIDIGAPGTFVYSTTPNDNYGFNTGTSMSAPHVSGTVALLFSAACSRFLDDYFYDPPGMSLLIKEYLLQSVDQIPDLDGKAVSGGRLNIFNALELLREDYCVSSGNEIPQHSNQVRVFPNPVAGKAFLQFENMQTGIADIAVFNLTGQLVMQQKLILPAGQNRVEIDFSGLPAGMYNLRLNNGISTPLIII